MRQLAILLIASCAIAPIAAAQVTANAPVTLTLEEVPITITLVRGMAFGKLLASDREETYTIPLTPSGADPLTATSGTAAFSITKQEERTVTFSCPTTVTLASADPANTTRLTVTPNTQMYSLGYYVPFACPGTTISWRPGELVIEAGGSVVIPRGTKAGAYAGTFTVGVSY